MKISLLRVIAAVAALAPVISANAALVDYNEQFVANNILYNLNFQADDTVPTEITIFNGTAGTDALTLAPIRLFGYSDNWFNPATIATQGGWNSYGLGFHNSVSGEDFNVYNYSTAIQLAYLGNLIGYTTSNYSYSPSPVPVPAAVWLFASGLGLLTVGRRKKMA